MAHYSTTSSFRGVTRDNEINSLCRISDDLATRLLLQGILGEVLHAQLVPSCSHTPDTSSLQICLLCPLQSQFVSGGHSGSLSHPPPPRHAMPLPCLQCCWRECNACIRGPSVHIDFSFSEFPPGVELQTICLDLLWLGTFAVEASDLSTWRPSVDASAESAGVRG